MSEIEVYEQAEEASFHPVVHGTLFGSDDPSEVVERAAKTANALAAVVKGQKLSTNIQGREHVRVEGWTLLGSMLGVFPVVAWTKEVGDGQGWEARVEARTRDGAIVGAAEAECLRSEKTWKNRDSYALRSMAQTRATSKALRGPLGFVMTIAGFEATPEEEMPREEPQPEVRSDGKQPEKPAKSLAAWQKHMEDLEIPRPMDYLRAACDAVGITDRKWGNVSQRANRVMLHFCDTEPKSSLGFWNKDEVQAGFAIGFDGALIELPEEEASDDPGKDTP